MDYLERLYINELNAPDNSRVELTKVKLSNGNYERRLIIDGNDFVPSRILSDDKDAFGQSFDQWKEDREKDLLKRADEILKLYDNEKRFERLARAYKANQVMPFVGAGMSIPSGYLGWTSFLFELHKNSTIEISELKDAIEKGEYELAAQLIYDDLGSAVFNERLENEYGGSRERTGCVNRLPEVFPNTCAITTNFDKVVEKCFEDSDLGYDETKSGKYLDEVLRLFASGSKILIKLHGHAEEVAHRVLTRKEYDVAYGDQSQIVKFFQRIVFKGSLLFLGCSLSNDRTIQTMKAIVAAEGAEQLPRHFAFIEEISDSIRRNAKMKFLGDANIFPIWYPEGLHDESVEALLVKLISVSKL
jgi:hypothetical protein